VFPQVPPKAQPPCKDIPAILSDKEISGTTYMMKKAIMVMVAASRLGFALNHI
jgi:hypothetical protein